MLLLNNILLPKSLTTFRGIILASSANSIEIGELGTTDQTNWQQWLQMDEARAELPLTDDKLENYPIGVCYDSSATVQLPWGTGYSTASGLLKFYFMFRVYFFR